MSPRIVNKHAIFSDLSGHMYARVCVCICACVGRYVRACVKHVCVWLGHFMVHSVKLYMCFVIHTPQQDEMELELYDSRF